MNIQAIFTRTKTITTFTYTNETATEKAWLVKTMKQYIAEYDRPSLEDESDVAYAWYALKAAYTALEDLKSLVNTTY